MINACQYLFEKSASDIFNTKQFDENLINDSLQTVIRVSDFLATKPEALFLYNPMSFNNQCHLYALMTVQKETDKRFFRLAFLLNFGFLTDASLMEKVVVKHAQNPLPEPVKKFRTFLKDPGGCIRKAARLALNELFKKHVKTTFTINQSEQLYKELLLLSEKNLYLAPFRGSVEFYTLPKLAGVAYLANTLAKEKLPLLFRIRVMEEEGSGSFTFCRDAVLEANTPVIVFELFASNSLTTEECNNLAKKCPSHLLREQRSRDRHQESATCLFCSPNKIDVTPYKERFLPVLEKMEVMLFALGIDFMLEHQKTFLSHFENESEFPNLTHLFQEGKSHIEEFSLSRTKKGCMSVFEVLVDLFGSTSFLMDATYATHLKERKLI